MINLCISRAAVGACETEDGLGECAKDPPIVDVPGGAVDGLGGVGSTKRPCGGSSAARAARGVGRDCLDAYEAS
ncbi:UNVERIFIED_CONTAM: hypothetical protein Sradi_2033000 [Sesamum radiatum]|uniref:Uncharacterized protein n=1 Tax=Sesamum radiatum TaxID=300843 RepID=A0AAW2TGS3_SESRA